MRTRRSLAALFVPLAALYAVVALATFAPRALAQSIIHVPADQPTIQAGINAANNGDTVLVSPGTYYENIDFTGKAITVTSSAGAATTIIDGGGKSATVLFKTSELRTSVLSGFTIQGGGPHQNVPDYGSGIEIQLAAPTILDNIVANNACHGIEVDFSAPLIQSNTVSGTTSLNGDYCSFNGSGILLIGNPLDGGANPVFRNLRTTVIGNSIQQNLHAISYDGGGIMIWANEGPIIEDNVISDNATTGEGGAIASFNSVAVTILQNMIIGNSATENGASISLHPPGASIGPFIGIIAGNTFSGNKFSGPSPNTNQAQSDVYLEGNLGQYVFVNNIVSASMSFPAFICGTTYNYLSLTPLVFDHNDIYNSQGPAYGGACPDQTGTYGNISADPMFLNSAAGNFQLSINSPAVDSGNNSTPLMPATDLAGNPRIQDATGKGYPIVDMGAYELAGRQDAAPTILTLTPSAYEITGGGSLILTAAASSAAGIPQGPFTIFEDGNSIGGGSFNTLGTGSYIIPVMTPGVHAFYAAYPGQGVFPPAVSVKFYVLVDKYVPTLRITSSLNPSLVGQSVTFTITVSSPDNTVLGPITLTDGLTNTTLATLTPNSSGIATYTTSSLSVGYHGISAGYAGDATHNSATAYLLQQVVSGYSTSSTLTPSLNPAAYGQSVTFTATVTNTSTNPGSPTGSITFSDGATVLATQPLIASGANSAIATFSTSSLAVGTHPIAATYVPTGNFAASTGSLTQVVIGLSTTNALTSSLNPANLGQSVTFTATVANTSASPGSPTGSITFSDGATVLATQPLTASGASSASASFTTSALAAGSHPITATYVPIGGFAPGSAQLTQTIDKFSSSVTLVAAPPTTLFGSPVTLTAFVSNLFGAPTGSVAFYDGASIFATISVDANGHAIFTTSSLAVGSHTLTAVYSGDSAYAASTSPPVIVTIQALPQDFTITLASPSITIQAQHHATTSLTLAGINGFADSLAIACANLPQYVTCKPTPTPAALTAGASATVQLYLDTDSVLGYAHLAVPAPPTRHSAPITLAFLLSPFALFSAFASRRKFCHMPLRLFTFLLALLPLSLAVSGCTTIITAYDPPPFAAPGTYTIPITATGAASHISHSANLTLTITP